MPADRPYYPMNWPQWERLLKHPKVSTKFALDKRLWDGRKVGVVAITRGNHRRHTERRVYYGTLVLDAGSPDQIGVRHTDGTVSLIHKTRGVDVYDLTRAK